MHNIKITEYHPWLNMLQQISDSTKKDFSFSISEEGISSWDKYTEPTLLVQSQQLKHQTVASNLFKVNMNTSEWGHWRHCSAVIIVDFGQANADWYSKNLSNAIIRDKGIERYSSYLCYTQKFTSWYTINRMSISLALAEKQ